MIFSSRDSLGKPKIFGVLSIICAGLAAYQTDILTMLAVEGASEPAHYETSARVVAVEKICRLQFDAQAGRLSRPMGCNQAREVVDRPIFHGSAVIELDEVAYRYQGPEGGEHTGWLETTHHPETPAYEINDPLPIRVKIANPKAAEPL